MCGDVLCHLGLIHGRGGEVIYGRSIVPCLSAQMNVSVAWMFIGNSCGE